MRTLVAIARIACTIRYRIDHRFGWFRAALAMADSYLYAGLVFLVVSAAFDRGGVDRYFLIALGIIGLRWTLSCVISADTVTSLAALLAGEVRAARLHALVYVMAPPTLIYLGSLAGFVIVTQFAGSGENTIVGLPSFPVLFGVHLALNAAAVLLVGEAFRRGWLTSTVPVLLGVIAIWFVSPVMYRFDDLGLAGVSLLTRWSPGSHLIAAYHNSFWFGQPMSLEVLPAVGLAASIVAVALLFFPRTGGPAGAGKTTLPALPDAPLTLLVDPLNALGDGGLAAARTAGWAVRGPVRRVPRGMTGQDWARLVCGLSRSAEDGDFAALSADIEAQADIGDLYRRSLSLYPDSALDRLAMALAMTGRDDRPLWLVGLFDALPREQVPERWAQLDATRGGEGKVVLVTGRLLLPGDTARGDFALLGPGGAPVSGSISADLAPAYAEWLDSASHSRSHRPPPPAGDNA